VRGLHLHIRLCSGRASHCVFRKPLQHECRSPARSYKLATNDFLRRGGDGFSVLTGAKVLSGDRDGKLIANDVMVHIRKLGKVTPLVDGRITIR
jgi:hypothetical protein